MTQRFLTITTVLTTLACVAALVGCGSRAASEGIETGAGSDPAAAVRDFLISGALDNDGYQACVALTPREQREMRRRAGVGECREAFDKARLDLPNGPIHTVDQVEGLPMRVDRHGDRADVRIEGLHFELVRADYGEQEEFLAPDTSWRIARGAAAIVPRDTND